MCSCVLESKNAFYMTIALSLLIIRTESFAGAFGLSRKANALAKIRVIGFVGCSIKFLHLFGMDHSINLPNI